MVPFEERWGIKAVEILKEWFDATSIRMGRPANVERVNQATELREGTLAWKIACALQDAHDDGYSDGHDDGSAPSSKDYGRDD